MLATTRVTRGEEDAGRWDLLLAGRPGIADVVIRSLTGLVASATLIGVTVAVALLAGSYRTGRSNYSFSRDHRCRIVFRGHSSPRRPSRAWAVSATGLAVAALGVGLAMRMIADSSPDWHGWPG